MAFEEEYNKPYGGLEELSDSDWEIKDGEPDITGWSVFNAEGNKIGEVADLLFDPQARKVRYIILELQANGLDVFEDRTVLIPIGVAQLLTHDDDVLLPLANARQLTELPVYEPGNLTPETETRIRQVFEGGSTAPYEHPQFYAHQHFDEDKFYARGLVIEEVTMADLEDAETDVTEEDPEDAAARALKVSRIVERINHKDDQKQGSQNSDL